MTVKHELEALEQKLPELETEYRKRMEEFLAIPNAHRIKRKKALQHVHDGALEYFNTLDEVISRGVAGLVKDSAWYTDKANTATKTLDTIKQHYGVLFENAQVLELPVDPLKPGRMAYANIQRIVKSTNPELAQRIRDDYIRAQLPTEGFDEGEAARVKAWEKTFATLAGTVFLVVTLIIALFVPKPSEWQEFVFRIILGLSGGAFAALITGFLHIEARFWRVTVRAGSGLGVFAVIYFINPPALIVAGPPPNPPGTRPTKETSTEQSYTPQSQPTSRSILAGLVLDAETKEPLADVELTIQDLDDTQGKTPVCRSDKHGRFRFKDLPPSELRQVDVWARKPGYGLGRTDSWLGNDRHLVTLVKE